MKPRFGRPGGSGVSFFAFQDIITGTSGFLIVLTLFLALNLDEVLFEGTQTQPLAQREEELRAMQSRILSFKKQVADLQNQPAEDEATLRRMIGQQRSTIALLQTPPTPGQQRDFDATAADRELRLEKQKLLTRLEKMNASMHSASMLATGTREDILDLEKKLKDVQSSLQRARDQGRILSLIPERSDTNKEPVLVLVQGSLIRFQRADGAPGVAGSIPDFIKYLRGLSASTHYLVLYFKPSGANHFESLTQRSRQEGFEIGYDVVPEDLDVQFQPSSRPSP